jgi:hypothetical protein
LSERRRKRSIFDLFDFSEEDFLFRHEPLEGESGYSISVTYDSEGKPVVRVKTSGNVDVAELRKDIEERYPGARIEGLEEKPLIRIVGGEETKKEKVEKKEGEGEAKRKGKGVFIREVE